MALAQSYEMVGRILAKLILGGLRRQSVTVQDAAPGTEGDRDSLRHFVDIMVWLAREGLIDVGAAFTSGNYSHVQLTAKGVAAAEQSSFGPTKASIREVVESQPTGSLGPDTYAKIGALIGGWMGAFVQSAQ